MKVIDANPINNFTKTTLLLGVLILGCTAHALEITNYEKVPAGEFSDLRQHVKAAIYSAANLDCVDKVDNEDPVEGPIIDKLFILNYLNYTQEAFRSNTQQPRLILTHTHPDGTTVTRYFFYTTEDGTLVRYSADLLRTVPNIDGGYKLVPSALNLDCKIIY
jgi:hypothetical protein